MCGYSLTGICLQVSYLKHNMLEIKGGKTYLDLDQRSKGISPINWCTFPMMIQKIERFCPSISKPTNQNLRKVAIVVKPTNKKTLLYNVGD